MKIAVVGGGASGLVAAIYAAKTNNEVILIEKNDICGKKILITGNGRCNYFNSDINENHYISNKEFLKSVLTENNKQEILNFLESIGIVPNIKNNYYYPRSNKAVSVRNALLEEAKLLNITIKNNFDVQSVVKEEQFIIKSNTEEIRVDKVILALGSKAYPKTGSDGFGYNILKSLGHEIIKPLPALVPLVAEGNFNAWAGARSEAKLTLLENNQKTKEEIGEVQFTDYGISGICVFNLSLLVSLGLDQNKNEEVLINFLPWLNNIEEVLNYLEKRSNIVTGRNVFELLEGLLDEKIINVIVKNSNIDEHKYFNELNSKEKYRLAENLYAFKLKIITTKSFDHAQITLGGVNVNEINPLTMESNIINGLYVTGELLDVNGECGGFNLAFAFISGMLAGKGTKND